MKRLLIVEFTKMEGAGNDFIVLDNRFFHFTPDELGEIAETFCSRRTGIGADGLLALEAPSTDAADFRMRYRNADGTQGTMCGNGARCIALFAHGAGVAGQRQTFDTDAGVYQAEIGPSRNSVRLWMPKPLPKLGTNAISVTLQSGLRLELHQLWTGTEHVVTFVDDLEGVDVESIGREIRLLPQFEPNGTNVNFAQLSRAGAGVPAIRARTYEKGVESETLACGTGAVAIAIASVSQRSLPEKTLGVQMRGGVLTVGLTTAAGEISELYLEGEARQVFRGTFELK
ncbi:MAG: diaminopimelate epimerase [Rhodothermia bacterium]|nr:diaminopimelate epimerase [Rhodothermia bacterium]